MFAKHSVNAAGIAKGEQSARVSTPGAVERLRGLGRDSSGNISVIFAFALLPVFATVGMSIDYGRAVYVKTRMQSALDAAVLAGGREFQMTGETAAAETATRSFFEYRFAAGRDTVGSPHVTAVVINQSTYTITAAAQASVPTPFLRVVGYPALDVATGSQSSLAMGGGANDKDIEVSMMIDITGSMSNPTASGNSKLHDAKLAAKDLIDIVIPSGYTGPNKARIALVPFSQYVNVGNTYYQAVTGKTPSGGNTCVTERTGADAYTSANPNSGSWIGEFRHSSSQGWLDCAPAAEIIPLTDDKARLKSAIDGYAAAGWTAGHLGTAWAWYTLSHSWNVWPNESRPKNLNSQLIKVAVLMTDGDYNTYFRNGTSSNDQALNHCTGMKAEGIRVYTVGFGTSLSAAAKAMLRDCASAPEDFFDVAGGDELRAAFRSIALTLAQLRLTQ
jgi:Flp pilus assembly protein TadG